MAECNIEVRRDTSLVLSFVPELDYACGIFSLKFLSTFIGFTGLLLTLLLILLSIPPLLQEDDMELRQICCTVGLQMSFVLHVLLLFGVLLEKPVLMIPHIMTTLILLLMITSTSVKIILNHKPHSSFNGTNLLFSVAFYVGAVYVWVCVYSYYRRLVQRASNRDDFLAGFGVGRLHAHYEQVYIASFSERRVVVPQVSTIHLDNEECKTRNFMRQNPARCKSFPLGGPKIGCSTSITQLIGRATYLQARQCSIKSSCVNTMILKLNFEDVMNFSAE